MATQAVTGISHLFDARLEPFAPPSPYPAEQALTPEQENDIGNHFQLRQCWAHALKNGRIEAVRRLVTGTMGHWPQISANFSPTDGGLNPITFIAQNDQRRDDFTVQRITAETLIRHGVELRVPDHRCLLPADHALMSANTDLAVSVVMATIEQFENRKNGDPYKPGILTYFASEPATYQWDKDENPFDERNRLNAYCNLLRSHKAIGVVIMDRARNHKDMVIRGMDDAQMDFWVRPLSIEHRRATYGRMPRPGFELEEMYGTLRAELDDYDHLKREGVGPHAVARVSKTHSINAASIERFLGLQAAEARKFHAQPTAQVF
jgi:hypothetical protein